MKRHIETDRLAERVEALPPCPFCGGHADQLIVIDHPPCAPARLSAQIVHQCAVIVMAPIVVMWAPYGDKAIAELQAVERAQREAWARRV